MSDTERALVVYDIETGGFQEKIKINLFGSQIESVNDEEFLVYTNHNSDNSMNVHRVNKNGEIIQSYFKYNSELKNRGITLSGFLSKSNDQVYFSEPYDELIYAFDNEEKDFLIKYNTGLLSKYVYEN